MARGLTYLQPEKSPSQVSPSRYPGEISLAVVFARNLLETLEQCMLNLPFFGFRSGESQRPSQPCVR